MSAPMVPEGASHFCAAKKAKVTGSWAHECPEKCMEIHMTREEWEAWVRAMSQTKDEPLSLDYVFKRIVSLDEQFVQGWRSLPWVYWSNALAGEAAGEALKEALEVFVRTAELAIATGEFANQTKKQAGGGTKGNAPSFEKLKEELIDCFTYIVVDWVALGGTSQSLLEEALKKNEKNRERLIARGIIKVEL